MAVMIAEFENDVQGNPNILEIGFSKKESEFIMEILSKNTGEAIKLKNMLYGARGALNMDMDGSSKQNFKLECDRNVGKVKIIGNLFNAFEILKFHRCISSEFANSILDNTKVKNFLEETKKYVLPENRACNREKITLSPLQLYMRHFRTIDSNEVKGTLNALMHRLRSVGVNIKLKDRVTKSEGKNSSSLDLYMEHLTKLDSNGFKGALDNLMGQLSASGIKTKIEDEEDTQSMNQAVI